MYSNYMKINSQNLPSFTEIDILNKIKKMTMLKQPADQWVWKQESETFVASILKEYYEIVGESRPLSAKEMHFYSWN